MKKKETKIQEVKHAYTPATQKQPSMRAEVRKAFEKVFERNKKAWQELAKR
ncbi:MAG: hypothetical protein KIT08_02825 [Anaerolineales bacterium]|nr:MAG: hypothetical protein KIT08_02825 [Anaerolineales bacterium]